ncbi:cytochrome C [candidate division GN15 bacterium]|nr:cytochrome C [candidate division GN15 bacterium]
MFRKYVGFVKGVSVNRLGKVGVVLTTSSFVTFVLLELARLIGMFTSSYGGLITYLTLPTLFVIGLVILPIAWYREKKKSGLSTRQLIDKQFDSEEKARPFWQSPLLVSILGFTAINIVFLVGASSRMLSFMDEPEFCGTACHSVMHPEWATYQDSPHARVKCVECHVGEGVDALVDSKLNGMWQMISVTFNLYEKPIPIPVRQLRPAQETCEKCHWPAKFYGERIDRIVRYADDSASTPSYTTLVLKVDTGSVAQQGGIHWHISDKNQVRYTSVNDERETMIWVEVLQEDGTYKRYVNEEIEDTASLEDSRILDCVDCHNRATHIYEDPERAVDERIRKGLLPRELPYFKREAVHALTITYGDSAQAMQGIENQLYGFYRREFPELLQSKTNLIDSAVAVLRDVYRRNVHHKMNVMWNVYPNHLGHERDGGCYRCHSPSLVADDGSTITTDCTACHSFAAYDSNQPFEFTRLPDTVDRSYRLHQYLRAEWLRAEAR